jgi:acetyltransferase-like isoleucine patch superfamily enzyme
VFWKVYKRILKLIAKYAPGYRFRCQLFRMAGYKVGKQVFIGEDLIIKDELGDRGRLSIGDRVAIAERVTLVLASNPNFSKIRPFVQDVHGFIEIDDDAWLGTGCIILPNVRVGKGAVVGAGSVVTRDVPDLTVVVGAPAKPIKRLEIQSVSNTLTEPSV